MGPFILIPWAALAICMPIAKALGVASRIQDRHRRGRKTRVRDIVSDVREMQAAESEAYQRTAEALCGGDHAPEIAVKAAKFAMKAMTRYASPRMSDLLDESPGETPKET